jgi:hypothetical protein
LLIAPASFTPSPTIATCGPRIRSLNVSMHAAGVFLKNEYRKSEPTIHVTLVGRLATQPPPSVHR